MFGWAAGGPSVGIGSGDIFSFCFGSLSLWQVFCSSSLLFWEGFLAVWSDFHALARTRRESDRVGQARSGSVGSGQSLEGFVGPVLSACVCTGSVPLASAMDGVLQSLGLVLERRGSDLLATSMCVADRAAAATTGIVCWSADWHFPHDTDRQTGKTKWPLVFMPFPTALTENPLPPRTGVWGPCVRSGKARGY